MRRKNEDEDRDESAAACGRQGGDHIADFFPPNCRVDYIIIFLLPISSRQIAESISIADDVSGSANSSLSAIQSKKRVNDIPF